MNKVLVVDDTKNIRTLLTTCLEIRGSKVLTADSGKVALDIIKSERTNIDLIFLDIRMPEMNGTEVLKVIRDRGLKCPVVIMTAYATVKNAVDCTKLGAAAYLQKPFSPDRVNAVLDEIFNTGEDSDNQPIEQNSENKLIEAAKKLMAQGNLTDAHDNLKKALGNNPYNKEIYYLLSEVNEKIDNREEAKRFYTMAKLFESKNI